MGIGYQLLDYSKEQGARSKEQGAGSQELAKSLLSPS